MEGNGNEKTIDERLAALTMNLELLSASTHELRETVEKQAERDRQRLLRDAVYLDALGEILRRWADVKGGAE